MIAVEERVRRIGSALSHAGREIDRRRGAYDSLSKQAVELADRGLAMRDEQALKQTALEICKAIEEDWQKTFEQSVADVVSQGLTLVFGKPLVFHVESNFQRDASAVNFLLEEDGRRGPILGFKGGGYVNVTTFLLRVLLLLNARPALRRLLVLDEAFENVSAEFTPNVGTLLRKLCDETGVQIILATQKPELGEYADYLYEVNQTNGVSTVDLISKGEAAHLYEEEDG